MRNFLKIFILLLSPIIALAYSDANVIQKIEKDLDAIIVKDLNKKQLIFQKDANQLIRPASLTKIMTSIIAIESGKWIVLLQLPLR